MLESADADRATAGAATPFELCLALLTGTLPGGESWPPGGKELPVQPFEPAAAPGLPPPFLLAPALTAAALQTRPPPGDAPLPVLPAGGPVVPSSPPAVPTAIVPPPVSDSELPTAATAVASQTFADLALSAAWATTDAVPAPLEVAASEVASTSTTAKTAPAPAWVETFAAHERRWRPPSAVVPLDPRAAVSPATPPAPVANAVAATDPALVAESAVRSGELSKILLPVATTGESASTADWLQPAVPQGTTTNGAGAPPAVLGAPVDLRSPSWHETFTNRVQWLVDSQVGEARIKLNPPELGAVDVKISLVDDKTYVQLTTATAAARDELAQSLPRLRELFAGSGLELGGASVHNGRGEQHASRGYGAGIADRDSPSFMSFGAAADEVPVSTLRRSLGRIDVFA